MKMAKRVDYVGQADHLTKGSQHPSHVGSQICSIKQHTFELAFLLYYHLPKTSLSFFFFPVGSMPNVVPEHTTP